MFIKACRVLMALSITGFTASLHAQKSIPLFFEKVYLHTDRSLYAGGDNIWFKSYLVNPRTNMASSASDNLYVELFAPDAKLVKKETIHLENGLGKGDFKLLDSIAGGTYHIRAYTNWMKNFGKHFFFEKDIQVAAVTADAKTGTRQPANGSSAAKAKPGSNSSSIQFFPEGGTLVADIPSVVAFKALNVSGKGTGAKGSVISEKGDTVAHFSTTYLGMGSFTFTPHQDVEYRAVVTYQNGSTATVDLPAVYAQGYALSLSMEDTSVVVNIVANKTTSSVNTSNEAILAGRNAGKLLYKEKVPLKDGRATIKIGKHTFPNGIAAFTVYDDKLRPNAERLAFIENKDETVKLTVITDKTSYQSKDKVVVSITATDAANAPIAASFSMAVVDALSQESSNTNIASYLGLESELKGNIENPAAYFDVTDPERFEHLDLLLRTQGWRDFLWKQIADTTFSIKYLPEQGISLSGYVKELFGKKLLPNMNITLLAPGAKGNKIYFTQTDSSGKYYLDGLPLYGTQSIKVNSKNNKGKKGGIIFLDSLSQPANYAYSIKPIEETEEIKQFAEEAKNRWVVQKKINGEDLTLPGVVVTANTKPTVTRDGTVEINSGYAFTAQINASDKQFGTLDNYLIHKTSAIADVENEGVNYQVNGKLVRPRFVVDNREDVFERVDYYAIPVDQIVSVNLNQVVSNVNGNLVDRIVIHLILKPGAYNQDMALLITDVDGYYESRTFYAPTYFLSTEKKKQDVRTTIFWDPQIVTDANGKATVTFFNADPKTKIKLSVQGLSNKGVPIASTTEYMVK